jgi:hypothetical protein
VLEAARLQECEQCDALHAHTSKMAASELKSLLQKIIRFGAPRVHTDTIDISAERALAVTMASLASLRGYFLPDLGVYVTGVHALAKRLMVIIMEDAAPEDLRPEELAALAACALLSQNDQRWFPSIDMLGAWVQLSCRARASRARFDYDAERGKKLSGVTVSSALDAHDHYGIVSATLDEVGSFDFDKGLARHIATATLRPVRVGCAPSASMPLWHCYDQHVSGNILYMLPPSFFVGVNDRNATQFYDGVYTRIFGGVTGVNPRRTLGRLPEGTPVWDAVRAAQKRYFHALHRAYEDTPAAASAATREFAHTLDTRWLAAMLGDREHMHSKKPSGYYAGLDIGTCAPGDYVATRKPTSGDDTVDESKRQLAMAALSDALSSDQGVPLRACDAPHESLRNASVRLRDGAYEVRVGHA